MNYYLLYFSAALIAGIISFLAGLKIGSKNQGDYSNSPFWDYNSLPAGSSSLLKIAYIAGKGSSKNDDDKFEDVIQYQEDTLPVIIKMLSNAGKNE